MADDEELPDKWDKDKTKKEKRRDPNRPYPKRKRRSGLWGILKIAIGGAMVVLTIWMGMYSTQVEKLPWNWSGEEWSGFMTFSMQQVEDAKKQAKQQLDKVDWDKLWAQAGDLEKKLDAKLAQLRGTDSSSTGAKTGSESGTGGTTEAAAPAKEPTKLELGCEALRKAIGHYRKSKDDQDQLKKAKVLFLEAREHLEVAFREAESAGDSALAREIEGYLMECQKYLEDCSKREILELKDD